jgi:hypothetical protein
VLAAHCLQLYKRHVAGSGNFESATKDIAKEILILRKELAEDEQHNIVLSGIKVVDRGQAQPLQARCAGCGAGCRPASSGPGQHAGPGASAAMKCWGATSGVGVLRWYRPYTGGWCCGGVGVLGYLKALSIAQTLI